MIDDDRVVTLLRDVVSRDDDAHGVSPEAAIRTGRRRSVLRSTLQVGAAALVVAALALSTTVLPRLVGDSSPAGRGPSVEVSASPTTNAVQGLYAAYDAAITRNGLRVVDTRWSMVRYGRPGSGGRTFQEFLGSRSLQNLDTGGPVELKTVTMSGGAARLTQDEFCAGYLANGFGCETVRDAEGLTLVRVLDGPGGRLMGVELWHPTGVVSVMEAQGGTGAVTEAQLLDLAQDPALRW